MSLNRRQSGGARGGTLVIHLLRFGGGGGEEQIEHFFLPNQNVLFSSFSFSLALVLFFVSRKLPSESRRWPPSLPPSFSRPSSFNFGNLQNGRQREPIANFSRQRNFVSNSCRDGHCLVYEKVLTDIEYSSSTPLRSLRRALASLIKSKEERSVGRPSEALEPISLKPFIPCVEDGRGARAGGGGQAGQFLHLGPSSVPLGR